MTIENFTLQNAASQKLLGITIDRNNFSEHVSNLYKTVSLKITVLARVFPYMILNQRRTLMKAYFMSQYGYWPLAWTNRSKSLNDRINTLHERTLPLVYNNFTSSFTELLKKDNLVTIHQKNLQNLVIKMFKVKHNLPPEILTKGFRLKTRSFNTRNKSEFQRRNVNTIIYGSETLSSLGPQIWDLIPIKLRNLASLNAFNSKIKFWSTQQCPCRLCKKYINNLGFVNWKYIL